MHDHPASHHIVGLLCVPQSEDNLDEFRSLLTDAECARMFRYTQEMDQLRFLTCSVPLVVGQQVVMR